MKYNIISRRINKETNQPVYRIVCKNHFTWMSNTRIRGTPFMSKEAATEWIEKKLKYGCHLRKQEDGTITDIYNAPVEIISYDDREVIKAEMKLAKSS